MSTGLVLQIKAMSLCPLSPLRGRRGGGAATDFFILTSKSPLQEFFSHQVKRFEKRQKLLEMLTLTKSSLHPASARLMMKPPVLQTCLRPLSEDGGELAWAIRCLAAKTWLLLESAGEDIRNPDSFLHLSRDMSAPPLTLSGRGRGRGHGEHDF